MKIMKAPKSYLLIGATIGFLVSIIFVLNVFSNWPGVNEKQSLSISQTMLVPFVFLLGPFTLLTPLILFIALGIFLGWAWQRSKPKQTKTSK